MPDTFVIIPTYNERENLERTVGRLRQSVAHAHVVIIDDASPDGTGVLADQLAAEDAAIHVIHRPGKDGLGSAYIAGFRYGMERDARFLVQIDADGSHDTDELPRMLEAARDGADVVIASRYVTGGTVRNWSWRRRVLSKVGNAYARGVLGSPVRDMTAGYRVYRADILRQIGLDQVQSAGYAFQIEMTVRCARAGAQIEELPSHFTERALGTSKMHAGIVLEALRRVTSWGLSGVRARPPVTPRAIQP